MRAMLLAVATAVVLIITGVALWPVVVLPSAAPVPGTAYQPPSEAGKVFTRGTYSVVLTELPCPFEEIALQLESEGIPPAKASSVKSGERRHTACWVKDMGGDVMTLEPGGGELGTIPSEWFGRQPQS